MGVCICPSLSSLDAPRVAIPLRRGRISLCECQESTVNFAEYQLILVIPMFLVEEVTFGCFVEIAEHGWVSLIPCWISGNVMGKRDHLLLVRAAGFSASFTGHATSDNSVKCH